MKKQQNMLTMERAKWSFGGTWATNLTPPGCYFKKKTKMIYKQ